MMVDCCEWFRIVNDIYSPSVKNLKAPSPRSLKCSISLDFPAWLVEDVEGPSNSFGILAHVFVYNTQDVVPAC